MSTPTIHEMLYATLTVRQTPPLVQRPEQDPVRVGQARGAHGAARPCGLHRRAAGPSRAPGQTENKQK